MPAFHDLKGRLFPLAIATALIIATPQAFAAGEYLVDEETECSIWNPYPEDGETLSYEGGCKDGRADGEGIALWYIDDELAYTLEGRWTRGRLRDGGLLTYSDDSTYEGEFKDNLPDGDGTTKGGEDPYVYVGEHTDGQMTGAGEFTFSDGATYVGDVLDGQMTGVGAYVFADGTAYEGDIVEGQFEGQGTIVFTNGDVYTGDFTSNKLTGNGRLEFADGAIYEGEFEDSVRVGLGKLIYGDGAIYEGEFVDDEPNGEGTIIYADGTEYTGEFEDGVPVDAIPETPRSGGDEEEEAPTERGGDKQSSKN